MNTIFTSPLTRLFILAGAVFALTFACGIKDELADLVDPGMEKEKGSPAHKQQIQDYYEKLFKGVTKRARNVSGINEIKALDALPKDPEGRVNWTAAVVEGYIDPRGSLDPNKEEEPPLNTNIFIEAKVPLMANVIFPHSIHTYWLNCKTCHPKIFLPEAGANDISMNEIFKGQWCGRCHGKVAFNFWPRENCLRCHMVLKGESMQKERWR